MSLTCASSVRDVARCGIVIANPRDSEEGEIRLIRNYRFLTFVLLHIVTMVKVCRWARDLVAYGTVSSGSSHGYLVLPAPQGLRVKMGGDRLIYGLQYFSHFFYCPFFPDSLPCPSHSYLLYPNQEQDQSQFRLTTAVQAAPPAGTHSRSDGGGAWDDSAGR